MKRLVVTAIVLAATAGTASAGGFVGLGIGGSPGLPDSYQPDGRTGRLEVGYSFGRFGIEGLAQRFDMRNSSDFSEYGNTTLALAGLFELPLSDGFGVYGRLGLEHMSYSTDNVSRPDRHYSGTGLLLGGGFDYRLPIKTNLAIFVDYTIATSSVKSDEFPDVDGAQFTTRSWVLGARLGF